MPVTGFQDVMLPLMRFASDGEEHKLSEAVAQLSDDLGSSTNSILWPVGPAICRRSDLGPFDSRHLCHSEGVHDNRSSWGYSGLRQRAPTTDESVS
jgi:hypothetical protein